MSTEQEEMMKEKGYLSLNAVAELLKIDKSTAARWAKQEKVDSVSIGQKVYIDVDSLVDYVGDDVAKEVGLL